MIMRLISRTVRQLALCMIPITLLYSILSVTTCGTSTS